MEKDSNRRMTARENVVGNPFSSMLNNRPKIDNLINGPRSLILSNKNIDIDVDSEDMDSSGVEITNFRVQSPRVSVLSNHSLTRNTPSKTA